MKKLILVVLILVLMQGVCAADRFQNEPDGFRGIKWGATFDSYKDEMKLVDTDESWGGVGLYVKNGDDYKIGSAVVDRIEYGFWQGQLILATIHTTGYVNWNGVHESLIAKFGHPVQMNRYIENYNWWGSKTLLSSNFNEVSKKGKASFYSKIVTDTATEWEKGKAKQGANSF
ncbi:MAG: hypothetical protein H6Q76_2471 [Firmicutes bacterium]|nr:hypothetical protein [Bacillota bacterium]